MAEALISVLVDQLVSNSVAEVGRLWGVKEEVEKLSWELQSIQAVLADAEQRQTRDRAVQIWLDRLKDLSYDMEDVLDVWTTKGLKSRAEGDKIGVADHASAQKVCFSLPSASSCLRQAVLHQKIAHKIKELNETLHDINRQKDMFHFSVLESVEIPERPRSSSLALMSEVYGRDADRNVIVNKLLSEDSEDRRGLGVVSIVGMGGIGKTTLARLAYHDDAVNCSFEIKIWVCVSDSFDEVRIAKSIIEALGISRESRTDEFLSLIRTISEYIVGKKFLLVLDDVWVEDYRRWEPFFFCLRNGHSGSKILVTTRKESVARMMGSIYILTVKGMSDDECWLLFKKIALSDMSPQDYENLEVIGKEIVKKCKGLPLAIKTIGSLLRHKRSEEWLRILHSEVWQLEVVEKNVFAPLLLSYNDLPSVVKRCFSYCAIFPEDCEIDKDKLIKLWMAQGYLGMEKDTEMEAKGQKFFDLLVEQSLFQDFEKDDQDDILRCRMHDIVHDFVHSLAKNECLIVGESGGQPGAGYDKYRHSTLMLNEGDSFPNALFNAKKLRTLLIEYGVVNCSSIGEVLSKLFVQFPYLRALDLSGKLWYENRIIEIPLGIGKLICLRYLNLSFLKMKRLPETVCELYNLLTLELTECTNLKKLPQGIGKLINLRHLGNDGTTLSYLPKGFERLTCLRTLSIFVVSGKGIDNRACTLACLKYLNHLGGSLSVKKLGTVTNVSEVEEAELSNKRNLIRLYLDFGNDAEEMIMNKDEEARRRDMDKVVLTALQPPPNLEVLEIRDYWGTNISTGYLTSQRNLRILNLHNCPTLVYLPTLGILPSLESLSVGSMGRVKGVGNEFLGTESGGAPSSSFVFPFPELKSLKFVNMEEWKIWHCSIEVMPKLCSLSLVHCPKLRALPDLILQTETLNELNINWCPFLKNRYNLWTGYDRHIISRIPNITINFKNVQRDRP